MARFNIILAVVLASMSLVAGIAILPFSYPIGFAIMTAGVASSFTVGLIGIMFAQD